MSHEDVTRRCYEKEQAENSVKQFEKKISYLENRIATDET